MARRITRAINRSMPYWGAGAGYRPGNVTKNAWEPPERPVASLRSRFLDAGLLGAQCHLVTRLAWISCKYWLPLVRYRGLATL